MKTYLEGEIGECVGQARLGLIPTASLEQDGDAGRRLSVIDCCDFEALSSVYDGSEATLRRGDQTSRSEHPFFLVVRLFRWRTSDHFSDDLLSSAFHGRCFK